MTEFETMKVERTCRHCGAVHVLFVTATGYAAWDQGRGAYVQTAFPELSADERELFVSGVCGPCFDAMFADLDDEGADTDADTDAADSDEDDEDDTDAGRGPGEDDDMAHLQSAPTPAELINKAALGLTAEGEPATRGHLSVADPHWPRCATELPALSSPVFVTVPNVCNRPATLLMGFTAQYVDAMVGHRCEDDDCPIAAIGADPGLTAQLQCHHVPICAMHLAWVQRSEREFLAAVGERDGVDRVYDLVVIGVETASMINGHPEASIIDLRAETGAGT